MVAARSPIGNVRDYVIRDGSLSVFTLDEMRLRQDDVHQIALLCRYPIFVFVFLGVTHLVIKTKHMRASQEDCALDSLVLHATVFLFNCVSPNSLRLEEQHEVSDAEKIDISSPSPCSLKLSRSSSMASLAISTASSVVSP